MAWRARSRAVPGARRRRATSAARPYCSTALAGSRPSSKCSAAAAARAPTPDASRAPIARCTAMRRAPASCSCTRSRASACAKRKHPLMESSDQVVGSTSTMRPVSSASRASSAATRSGSRSAVELPGERREPGRRLDDRELDPRGCCGHEQVSIGGLESRDAVGGQSSHPVGDAEAGDRRRGAQHAAVLPQHSVADQPIDEGRHEEGVALGACEHLAGELRRGHPGREPRREHHRDRAHVEWAEVEVLASSQRAQVADSVAERRSPARRRIGPVRREHEQSGPGRSLREVAEQLDRRAVPRMEVLDHDDDRGDRRHRIERVRRLSKQSPDRPIGGAAAEVVNSRRLDEPRQHEQPRRRDVPEDLTESRAARPPADGGERVEERQVRLTTSLVDAPAQAEGDAGRRAETGHERLDERRLACAGLPRDESDGAGSRGRRGPPARELGEFAFAPDERLRVGRRRLRGRGDGDDEDGNRAGAPSRCTRHPAGARRARGGARPRTRPGTRRRSCRPTPRRRVRPWSRPPRRDRAARRAPPRSSAGAGPRWRPG